MIQTDPVTRKVETRTWSPITVLVVFAGFTFTAELIIMIFLDKLSLTPPLSTFADAIILTILVVPALILIFYIPLHKEALKQKALSKELKVSQETLQTVLDSLEAVVYVADIKTHELLFLNKLARDTFGDELGKPCWSVLQSDQQGPCDFCSNSKLLTASGEISGTYNWEFRNTINNRWYDIRDRAIYWVDGRLARLEIATDITTRKKHEDEREQLIAQLQKSLEEIELLQKIVPICSHRKKIRDDKGFWNQVEEYVTRHTGAKFSHSICPTCMEQHFSEYDD